MDDLKNVGESNYNPGVGTDQRVQSLVFIIIIIIIEALNDLYSPNIVRMIKSRKIRWAGHVARMGEKRRVYSVLVGKPEGK